MKRRKFLAIAGIGGLLAGLVSFRFVTTSVEEAAEQSIINELDYLTLDRDGVSRFVKDYTKSMTSKSKYMLKGYSFMGISPRESRKIHSMISAYLLSSDFFHNKMDYTRTVRYLGLYNPHARPCAHPFSNIYYPGEVG